MPTKKQIRKYRNAIRACNRIEILIDPTIDIYWFHFIDRKGKIVGFCIADEVKPETLVDQVIQAKKFATCTDKCLYDAGDPAIDSLRHYQEKYYIRGGVIVRNNGVWFLTK